MQCHRSLYEFGNKIWEISIHLPTFRSWRPFPGICKVRGLFSHADWAQFMEAPTCLM